MKLNGNLTVAGWRCMAAVLVLGIAVSSGLQAKSGVKVETSVKNSSVKSKEAVPHEINYQGWLGDVDDTTNAGVTGAFNMVFRLFTTATGGSPLWSEVHASVPVDKGIFNVLLGSVTVIPADIFSGVPLWLVTQVNSDTLSPRKKIVSVGYAIRSEVALHADTAGYVAGANVDGEVEKANRADTADYVAGGTADNDWVIDGNLLYPGGDYGLSMRSSNTFYGNEDSTHVNLGIACTTGAVGWDNKYCTVSGGCVNSACHWYTTVGGGRGNVVSGLSGTVSGGDFNTARGLLAVVGGGSGNNAVCDCATVGGGWMNTAGGIHSTVSGGSSDTVQAAYGGVASGWHNVAGDASEDTAAFVGGGRNNKATGMYAAVGGGMNNQATSTYATVGGGRDNQATNVCGAVGGGAGNIASDFSAVVSGGYLNIADDTCATIPGGYCVAVRGRGSFGFGHGSHIDYVDVIDDYDIVFGDGSYRDYEFGINQENPVHPLHIGTDGSNGNGAHLTAGGQWTNTSSRELKEDFRVLDGDEILSRVRDLSVCSWKYKGTEEHHIGPVAEDFHEAFNVGTDNRHLSNTDVAGVALIAIQQLSELVKEQQEEIEKLKKRLEEVEN